MIGHLVQSIVQIFGHAILEQLSRVDNQQLYSPPITARNRVIRSQATFLMNDLSRLNLS